MRLLQWILWFSIKAWNWAEFEPFRFWVLWKYARAWCAFFIDTSQDITQRVCCKLFLFPPTYKWLLYSIVRNTVAEVRIHKGRLWGFSRPNNIFPLCVDVTLWFDLECFKRHFYSSLFFFLSPGSFRNHTYCLKRNGIFGLRPSEIKNCLLLLFFEDSSHEQLFFFFSPCLSTT